MTETARAKETQHPPVPEPMEVNDVLIVTVGTVLFAIAFLVMLPFHTSLEHAGHGRWPWIALAGALLGVVGIAYCRRRAARIKASKGGGAEGDGAVADNGAADNAVADSAVADSAVPETGRREKGAAAG